MLDLPVLLDEIATEAARSAEEVGTALLAPLRQLLPPTLFRHFASQSILLADPSTITTR